MTEQTCTQLLCTLLCSWLKCETSFQGLLMLLHLAHPSTLTRALPCSRPLTHPALSHEGSRVLVAAVTPTTKHLSNTERALLHEDLRRVLLCGEGSGRLHLLCQPILRVSADRFGDFPKFFCVYTLGNVCQGCVVCCVVLRPFTMLFQVVQAVRRGPEHG